MIEKRVSADRHFNDIGWLQTYWLFSFGDYHDPQNMGHGSLRVFNDDVVQPGQGFGEHPHAEMEIISMVLEGEMTHRDAMGNEVLVRADEVQRMTAGTGLRHSGWNHGRQPVHFLPIWIKPARSGLDPSYDQQSFTSAQWQNQLTMLASSHPDRERYSSIPGGAVPGCGGYREDGCFLLLTAVTNYLSI